MKLEELNQLTVVGSIICAGNGQREVRGGLGRAGNPRSGRDWAHLRRTACRVSSWLAVAMHHGLNLYAPCRRSARRCCISTFVLFVTGQSPMLSISKMQWPHAF